MEQDRSFVYTLILGTCVLLCLLLLGRMTLQRFESVEATPESQQQTEEATDASEELRLTEENISEMIAAALPENFPINDITVTLKDNGDVYARGMVTKKKLQNSPAASMLGVAIRFLPNRFSSEIVFTATTEGKVLTLEPKYLRAAGIKISADMVPKALSDTVNEALNKAMENSGFTYSEIALENGALILKP